ncbi:hypothetical protein JX266_007140 [Neoarthrinium moseri]|uniref:uncharacterized protein n=1 Tax=Neoarthrinium moseri TaxID=1658444 RepID=UPI001FDC651F|nr:uncharacterized protein JN550_003608 [Neoarthrinium moseri]KAI1846919.1 hypothetical protein JX266_007140 [Neoarthrinium moseri]KAI1872734.1 hypothetical protein JN550_003608 [Neoarthrinium moseri]
MGGFRLCCLGPLAAHAISPGAPCECEETVLDREGLAFAISRGLLPPEPPITEQEILDQAKAGTFAKVLALWQIVWFLVSVVTRLVRQLPVAQLPVGVAGFAMLAIATLSLYFKKPKGVKIGTRIYFHLQPQPVIQLPRTQNDADVGRDSPNPLFLSNIHTDNQNEREPSSVLAQNLRAKTSYFTSRSRSIRAELMSHISLSHDDEPAAETLADSMFVGALLALPFGAVHAAAWNAIFPTGADQ